MKETSIPTLDMGDYPTLNSKIKEDLREWINESPAIPDYARRITEIGFHPEGVILTFQVLPFKVRKNRIKQRTELIRRTFPPPDLYQELYPILKRKRFED